VDIAETNTFAGSRGKFVRAKGGWELKEVTSDLVK